MSATALETSLTDGKENLRTAENTIIEREDRLEHKLKLHFDSLLA